MSISRHLVALAPSTLRLGPQQHLQGPILGTRLPRLQAAVARGRGAVRAHGDTGDKNRTWNTTASCLRGQQTLLPLALRLLLLLINGIICFLLQLFCLLRLQISSADGEQPKLLSG